ncbi:MAG TPA: alkaline phosphatase, partial [Pirellulaceae bacterium]
LPLDPQVFGLEPSVCSTDQLGRLQVTRTAGDLDQDGDFDELVTYGTRSFAIWTTEGKLVADSGDALEQMVARSIPEFFNSNGDLVSRDQRSDDKGPEPEGVVVGEVGGKTLAFVGLERPGAIVTVDLSNPAAPEIISLYHGSQFPESGAGLDQGPEGLLFIPAALSPLGTPLLVACFEASGTTRILSVQPPSNP